VSEPQPARKRAAATAVAEIEVKRFMMGFLRKLSQTAD
jgi:hypothetical protein